MPGSSPSRPPVMSIQMARELELVAVHDSDAFFSQFELNIQGLCHLSSDGLLADRRMDFVDLFERHAEPSVKDSA